MSNRRRIKRHGTVFVLSPLILGCGLGLVAASCPAAIADDVIHLPYGAHQLITGGGWAVAGAGDVNGDGRDDVVVGTRGGGYAVFGTRRRTTSNLADLSGGFRIKGENDAGVSVDGAGDINGDGFDDIVIGAPGQTLDGVAYVVFGGRGTDPVNLKHLGGRGFEILGRTYDGIGRTVAGAGDVNGDGYDDVVVRGDYEYDSGAYVVFGGPGSRDLDLKHLGRRGFEISGVEAVPGSYTSVDGAGDVNGDGLDDVIVAAPTGCGRSYATRGRSYVVFGRGNSNGVDLCRLGDRGFAVVGAPRVAVSGAGDVNGDGLDDVILGVRKNGNSFVVLGKRSRSTVHLRSLGRHGMRIDGVGDAGWSVAGSGDLNGDGRSDVLIGNPSAIADWGSPGSAFAVFGSKRLDTVTLASLAGRGMQILGESADDRAGFAVSGAGDTNGDGWPDLIVGAPGAGKGTVYVLLGQAAKVKLPKRVERVGKTVLLKRAVVTNAHRAASPVVIWSVTPQGAESDPRYAKVTVSPSGKVTLDTTGEADRLFVTLQLTAPATRSHIGYSYTAHWRVR